MGIYASDCETSGLLYDLMHQEHPKLHNFCSIDIDSGEIILFEGSQRDEIQAWFNEGHTFVTHNCATYDEPALQFLGFDTSKIKWIDSLALSWYLEPTRMKHGLAEYGEEFGVPKPKIDDWENQTQAEYNNRVIEDCKIQARLWEKQVSRLQILYGKEAGSYDRLIAYLMWKMKCLRMQQDNKWKLDIPEALKLQEHLNEEIDKKVDALRKAMPKNPKYAVRSKPAKPFKKSGELSATGEKWKELTESMNLPFDHPHDIKVITGYEEGNPASHTQMKAWLDSLGWVAETFKFVREDDGSTRQIPQINLKGGEICQSVKDLIPKCQDIEHIAGLGILNHRLSVVSGWLRDAEDGFITARAQGFTNTLRKQHKEYCNTPSTRVPYGAELRSLLIAGEGKVLCGSDLSGVENFIKNHYQWKLDQKYVETQLADGYDPHLDIAMSAGLISEEDSNWYKMYKKNKEMHNDVDDLRFEKLDAIRAAGKSTNYACLPMHTKVLTKEGWKLYSQISVGDVLQTFNPETGFVEDDVVLHKHFFQDKELFKYSNTTDTFQCTEEHRWYGWKRRRIGKVNSTSYKEFGFTKMSDMKQENNIILTAPYKTDVFSDVTVEEARFFGWLLSDGYYRWSDKTETTSSSFGKRKEVRASISQADSKYWRELEDCLSALGVVYRKSRREVENGNTINCYNIKSSWMRPFLDKHFKERINKHEVDWTKWVCNLSIPALEAFYEAFYLGDGGMKGRNNQEIISQNSGNIQDCLVATMQLLGRGRVSINRQSKSDCSGIRTQKRKHITMQEIKKESLGVQDTFCLTTNNSTFIIWQDDFIGITGNCQYGAGVATIARTAKVSEKVAKKLHEGYNKLNWSLGKIASMMVVKKTDFGNWQINPINKFWYSLRSDKDRCSTLIQGTAAYVFDIWLYQCYQLSIKRNVDYCLLAQQHDDQALRLDEGKEEEVESLVRDALAKVNDTLKLNVKIKCDVMFGKNGKEIH